MKNNLEKILNQLKEDKLESLLITKGTDIKYLTGFTGDDGVAAVIVTKNKNYFITDGRFITQALKETEGYTILQWESNYGMFKYIGRLLKELDIKSIVINYANISYKNYLYLREEYKKDIEDDKGYISKLRRIKNELEIQKIKIACKITQESFLEILKKIKIGMSEIELKNLLEEEMKRRGSEEPAFPTIIASGPDNGANPHASPSHRKIQKGDMITIDFGAKYENYCSDMTRTISIGEPSEELRKVYEIVKTAKEEGVKKLKSGVKIKDVCRTIKEKIEENGYILPHGPGHGFGLDIHENPFLTLKDEDQLEKNIVLTIEPGIYIPGIGGVRIEDDYLITSEGYELLTNKVTTDLIIV